MDVFDHLFFAAAQMRNGNKTEARRHFDLAKRQWEQKKLEKGWEDTQDFFSQPVEFRRSLSIIQDALTKLGNILKSESNSN